MAASSLLLMRRSGQTAVTRTSVALFSMSSSRIPVRGLTSCTHINLNLPKQFLDTKMTSRSTVRTMSSQSSSESESSYSPLNWWRKRQESKLEGKYREKIQEMAQSDTWSIGKLADEVNEAANSWQSKVPLINKNKETEAAKAMKTLVQGVVAVVGRDATQEQLEQLTRTQKLQAALAGEGTVEDINGAQSTFAR
jgi:hypothetical protein